MKGSVMLISLFVIFSFLTCCNDKHLSLIVPIQRIDIEGVHFQYHYLDSVYEGCFPLDISSETFYDSDSLKIKVPEKNPSNYKFISVVKKTWSEETVVIPLNKEERVLYGYHNVDQKPLFQGINNAHENDSAITRFFEDYYGNAQSLSKIGIFIIIDGNGDVTYKSSRVEDKEKILEIKKVIESMPKFTPPINNGDTVSVVYLIEVPVLF